MSDTAQDDPQEVQASTNSINGSSRKSRILEKKARRRELDKMKPGEIVGKMVVVKEEDGPATHTSIWWRTSLEKGTELTF
jgi:hypothetical protein